MAESLVERSARLREGLTVVVCVGDLWQRRNVCRTLAGEPGLIVVRRSGCGSMLLRHLRERRPHVAVLDQQLPDCDAAAVIRAGRAIAPEIRYVVLHRGDSPDSIRTTLAAGAEGHLNIEAPGPSLAQAVRATGKGLMILDAASRRAVIDSWSARLVGSSG